MRLDAKAQRLRTGQFLPFGSPPSPLGVCAPRKTKVVKVTKQSFRRMPVPKLTRLQGAHFVEAEVQSDGASAASLFL